MKTKKNKVYSLLLITCFIVTALNGCSLNSDEKSTTQIPSTLVDNRDDSDEYADLDTTEESEPVAVMPTEISTTTDMPTTDLQTTDSQTTEEVTTTMPEAVNTSYKPKLGMSDEEIAKLSNERQDNYYGGDVNAANIPMASLNFQQNYGKYNADFVRNKDDEKVLYLTFDEGYENGYTSQILDTLKEKNVKAVFFVTMPYAKTEAALVQRMINEGHIVGNHSVTHPAAGMISLTNEQQANEIYELHNYVKENYGGYEMCLFRHPAGIFSEQSLAVIGNCGYTSVFWSFAYADWDPKKQPDKTAAIKKMTDKLHPGAVYLLHAVSKTNADVLGEFIEKAQEKGYTFKAYY